MNESGDLKSEAEKFGCSVEDLQDLRGAWQDAANNILNRIEQAAQILWEDARNDQCDRAFNPRTQGAKILTEVRALRAIIARLISEDN